MSEWTEDEIRAMAKAYTGAPFASNRAISQTRRALSAVKRVPEGHWLAPDEPDETICDAIYQAETHRCTSPEVYRAMRDAVRKP